MKKVNKIIFIFLLIITLCSVFDKVNAADIWKTSKDFIETGASKPGMTDEDLLGRFGKFIGLGDAAKSGFEELIDFLWGIGLLVIFISTVVLGIKYMLVSPQEKSKIKQSTTPYIIGVVVIFGALTIWKFIILILDGSLNG